MEVGELKKHVLSRIGARAPPKLKKNVFGQEMNSLPEFLWSFSIKKERL